MTMTDTTPNGARRMTAVEAELSSVRERLARIEATMEAHEQALSDRHDQVMEAIGEMRDRQDKVDGRTWKLFMVLAVLGLSGGAGGAELLRSLLGGP
jgi:hypothetical protein